MPAIPQPGDTLYFPDESRADWIESTITSLLDDYVWIKETETGYIRKLDRRFLGRETDGTWEFYPFSRGYRDG